MFPKYPQKTGGGPTVGQQVSKKKLQDESLEKNELKSKLGHLQVKLEARV